VAEVYLMMIEKENKVSAFVDAVLQEDESYYPKLAKMLDALLEPETNSIAQLANCSALLFHSIKRINWVGFYLVGKNLKGTENELIVGPFQGKTACTRISFQRGVCGKCAREQTTILVPNVHEFEGHIACDDASLSEIVLPLVRNGILWGVLDIDSPEKNRFSEYDAQGLELIRNVLQNRVKIL
jgi:L-methionine (R)-S-oxide reductase